MPRKQDDFSHTPPVLPVSSDRSRMRLVLPYPARLLMLVSRLTTAQPGLHSSDSFCPYLTMMNMMLILLLSSLLLLVVMALLLAVGLQHPRSHPHPPHDDTRICRSTEDQLDHTRYTVFSSWSRLRLSRV